MKKLDHILHWDDYYIEGFGLFILILCCFYPLLIILLLVYMYWQRRKIRIPLMIVCLSLLLLRYYVFEINSVPKSILGEAKVTEVKTFDYSDMIILKYKSYYFQAFVHHDVYQVGDIVIVDADVKQFRDQTIPFGFNQKNYYLSQNVRGYLEIKSISFVHHSTTIYSIREDLNRYLSQFDSQVYIKALILGEKSFTEEQRSLYQNLGILYLFTVSGLHIYGLLVVIKKVFFYFSFSQKTQFILTLLVLCVISYFNQFSMSVLRIIVIYLLQHISKHMKMNLSQLDMIHLSFFIMLIYRIEWMYNIGFLMLFLILNFINLTSFIYNHLNFYLKRLMLSLIISMSILPFQLVVSPLLILLLPLIIVFLSGPVYALSCLVIFIPEIDHLLSSMLLVFENLMLEIESVQISIALPSLPPYAIMLYYVFLIYLFRARNIKAFLIGSEFLILLFSYFIFDIQLKQEINFYMIDVGQGDSFLIESPSCNILIDSYNNVLSLINDLGIYNLDYLILSHSDIDHIKEAQDVIDAIDVEHVIVNPYNIYPIYHKKIMPMKSDDQISCGTFSIDFLGPIREYTELNNNALVFKMMIGNQMFLFTGDIENKAEVDLIEKYGYKLKTDVLKVPHHGSSTSTTDAFISYVDPDVALISLGENNRYGFPNQDVIERLLMAEVHIYRTDTMGTIVYTYQQKKQKWSMWLPF